MLRCPCDSNERLVHSWARIWLRFAFSCLSSGTPALRQLYHTKKFAPPNSIPLWTIQAFLQFFFFIDMFLVVIMPDAHTEQAGVHLHEQFRIDKRLYALKNEESQRARAACGCTAGSVVCPAETLAGAIILRLRCLSRFFRDKVSFALVRKRLCFPADNRHPDEVVVKRHSYLAFLDLPDLAWLRANITFYRFSQGLEHAVQGSVRRVSYRGLPAYGVLLGHVQPSQAWKTVSKTGAADDYTTMFEFVHGRLTRSHCNCVTG